MKIKDVYKEIDFFVKQAVEKSSAVNIGLSEKEQFAFKYLVSERILIKSLNKNQYKAGTNCFEIYEIGIKKYLNHKNKINDLEFKIKNLTIHDLKGNIFQNKLWWVFIVINFIISILLIFIEKKYLSE